MAVAFGAQASQFIESIHHRTVRARKNSRVAALAYMANLTTRGANLKWKDFAVNRVP
jgi:hypothetical protein